MKKHRGFTLVEVMVGLLLVSFALVILASSYLKAMTHVGQGRRINTETAGLRNKMEEQVVIREGQMTAYNKYWDDATGAWKADAPNPKPLKPQVMYECCGMKVSGFPVDSAVDAKGRSLHSFVARKHREIRLPAIKGVELLTGGEAVNGVKFKYIEDSSADLSLIGSYTSIQNPDVFYNLQNKWYVSNRYRLGTGGNVLVNAASSDVLVDAGTLAGRTPRFVEDYTKLSTNSSKLSVSPLDKIYEDALVRYSAVPLSTNNYIGIEEQADSAAYFIGLPLNGSLANLIAHYNTDVVSSLSGDDWQDVRAYTKQMGVADQNPFKLEPTEIQETLHGNYAIFDINSSGSVPMDNMTLFFRIKNLEIGSGKKISLMQSGEPELINENLDKVQFDLSLDEGDLVLHTRKVVKKAPPDVGFQFEPVQSVTLLSNMDRDSSYRRGYEETDARKGFNVLSFQWKDKQLQGIKLFFVENPAGNELIYQQSPITIPDTVKNLVDKDILISAEKDLEENLLEGRMAISDLVAYPGIVSESFEKKVGEYLVHRYLTETPK